MIAIGCLVKGSTQHFEYIADAVTHGIMRCNLDHSLNPKKKPVIFIITIIIITIIIIIICSNLKCFNINNYSRVLSTT